MSGQPKAHAGHHPHASEVLARLEDEVDEVFPTQPLGLVLHDGSHCILKGLMKEIITVDKKPFQDAVATVVKDEAKRLGGEDFVNFILQTGKNF